MKNTETPLETLSDIRNLMERSSRFISLSGLSGVFAGFFALIGAIVAYFYLESHLDGSFSLKKHFYHARSDEHFEVLLFLLSDAVIVLILALVSGFYFTMRKAKKQNLPIWDKPTFRLLENVAIPLVAGGIFCLMLIYHNFIGLLAPSTLVFYGLALLNGSKYTLDDIRFLGIAEILLGLLAAFFLGYGLFFWAFGFGILHIWYGTRMYLKYEK